MRDYQTGTWEGGDPDCEHRGREKPRNDTTGAGTDHGRFSGTRGTQAAKTYTEPVCGDCPCGARRIDNQLGLEATPDDYVANMVEAFREVRRVLRADGTVWLNLGDSYSSSSTHQGATDPKAAGDGGPEQSARPLRSSGNFSDGLKPKDLVGIPWMVAFALRADGWWLRTDIVWAKRNCLPESVADRPTRSHEFIFLLTKSARYFYDSFATREPSSGQRGLAADFRRETKDHVIPGQSEKQHRLGREQTKDTGFRNKRDVWFIRTRPFPEAHFAVFPPELVEPCVKAGTSEHGCCAACGAPYRRVIERYKADAPPREHGKLKDAEGLSDFAAVAASRRLGKAYQDQLDAHPPRTVGWEPTCDCGEERTKPCVVLDPFAGSGTTLLVANRLGRSAIGVELSPEYAAMARRRLGGDMPLFAVEAP